MRLILATLILALGLGAPALAAELCVTFTIGATTAERCVTATDARALEFVDDLRNRHYPPDENGDPITRVQAGQRFVDGMTEGAVGFAQGLKRRRLQSEVSPADDLRGNTE